MSTRALPNSFPLGNITIRSCKEAPAATSSGLFRDTAPHGTGLKMPFKGRAGLVFKGFVSDLRVAEFLQTNCEEWVFCNVYDGGINMMFDEFCGSKRDARFGIGESKPMEGLLEGLSGRISLSFSGAASSC